MPRTANHKTEDESTTRVTRSLRNRIVTSNMGTPKRATRNKKLEDGKDLSTSPETLDQDNRSRASSTASFSNEDQSNGPEKVEGADSQTSRSVRKTRSKSTVDESLLKTPGRRITRTMSASEGGNVSLTPKRTSRRLNSSSEVDIKSNKSVTMTKFSPEPLLEDKDAEEKETLHRVRTRASPSSPHTTETRRTPIVKLTKPNVLNSPTKEPDSTNENNDSAKGEVEVVENKNVPEQNETDRKLEDIIEIEGCDLSAVKEKKVSFHHSSQAGDKSPSRFPKTPIASKSKILIVVNEPSEDKSEISTEPSANSETSSINESGDKRDESIVTDTSIIAPPPVETLESETPKLPMKKCVSQMSSSTPIESTRMAENGCEKVISEKTVRNLMDSNTSDKSISNETNPEQMQIVEDDKSNSNETNPEQLQIVEDDEEDIVEINNSPNVEEDKVEEMKEASESNQCVEKENENSQTSQQDVEMVSVNSKTNEKGNSFHAENDKAQKSEKIYSKSWCQSVRGTTSEGEDFIDGLGVLDRKESEVIKSKDDSNKSPHYTDEDDMEYYEEEEEEEEDKVKTSEFIDDEAMENDEDSLNSSEREYLKQNEIPVEGESIGSEDTNSMKDNEEDEENDSFIVSDVEEDKLSVDTNENIFSSENSVESNSENKNTSKSNLSSTKAKVGSGLRIEDYDDDESNETKQKPTQVEGDASQNRSTKSGVSLRRKRAISSSEDEVEETNLAKDVNDSSENLLDNNDNVDEQTPENQSESEKFSETEENPAGSSDDSNSNNKEEVILDETMCLNNLFDESRPPPSSQESCRSMEKLFVEEDSSNEDNDEGEDEPAFSKSSSSEIGESTVITKGKSSKKEIFHNISKLESKNDSDDSSSSSDDERIVSKTKRRDAKEVKTAKHISKDSVQDEDDITEVKKKKVKKPSNVEAPPSDEPNISSILQRCQEILQRKEEEKKKIRLEHKNKKVKKTKKKDKPSYIEEDNNQELASTSVKSKRKKENSTLKKETAKKIEHVKLTQDETEVVVPKVKPRQVEEVKEKRKRMFSNSSVTEQELPKKKKKLNVLSLASSSGKFKEEKLKNVNGFAESDVQVPESIGHKMKSLLNTEEFDYVSKKKKKIKRKREIPEPLTLLPKPQWSSSGDFTVAKLPKTGGEIYEKPSTSGSVTEFYVEPLNVKKRKIETDVEHRAMDFKRSALYNSDRIKRETSKSLLQRKKRQDMYKFF